MSATIPESIRDLAAGYALGALTAEETRAVEAALAHSPELEHEVAQYREVNALLGLTAGEGPAPDLRARLLQRIRTEKVAPLAPRWSRSALLLSIGLAASVVVAVGLGLRVRSLGNTVADRDRQLAAAVQKLQATEEQLARREQTLNTLLTAQESLTVVQLAPSSPLAPGIQFYWNRRVDQAILHAFRLPPAAAGKVYQLWLIRDGKPIPSTTFNADPDGHALVQAFPLPPGGRFTAVAVTVEPTGGSQTPTLPILLIGNIAGP